MSKCTKCLYGLGPDLGNFCVRANKRCEGIAVIEEKAPDYTKIFEDARRIPIEPIVAGKKENTYRDQLIQEIKDVGESLIYNAKNIASDYEFGRTLEIHISFDKFEGPIVRVDRDFYPEHYMYRLQRKEK